jgi:hypothetical protein
MTPPAPCRRYDLPHHRRPGHSARQRHRGREQVRVGSAIAVEDQDQSDFNVYYLNSDTVYSWLFNGINWYNHPI